MPVPTGVLTPTRRRGAALVLAAAVGLLTACSSSDDDPTVASGTTSSSSSAASSSTSGSSSAAGGSSDTAATAITATEADFSIDLDSTDLAAGDYTITVDNQGDATHDLVVERDGKDVVGSDALRPGASGTVTVSLEPGEYVFYCSIGNHRAMGMETTVTVS